MLFKKVLLSLGAAGALGGASVGVYHSVKKTDEQKPNSEGEGEKGPDTNPPPASPVIEHDSGDTVDADEGEEDNGESDGSNENDGEQGSQAIDTAQTEQEDSITSPTNPVGTNSAVDDAK